MSYLTDVRFCLPSKDKGFEQRLTQFLAPVGEVTAEGINLAISHNGFLPLTSFVFKGDEPPFVLFVFGDDSSTKVEIANTTGTSKQSPYRYSHIILEEFLERMKPFPLQGLDHVGFNLPYFEGVHPKILELRQELETKSLYHTFPKHLEDAPWDFIIPGTEQEISRGQDVDYQQVRKPKIEIVSFESSSTPLIQIDIQVRGRYEELATVFPEALLVPEIRNLWVYIHNASGVDICFVLNETSDGDWSYQFEGDRLL